ncbi:hypothetical protein HPP92_016482 [Vanilla planifolia]|uniref:Uncharacterized protein n=1 Tax=Vanilla planifolia TaxID=51239 RepID=A0A835UQJ4_VANPL|nr:hypothetical protein HPP92_017017 [Vanilla planifolia]KAG0471936.1 hypothetical protein HPP92_016482 [Vanilla planifolia]
MSTACDTIVRTIEFGPKVNQILQHSSSMLDAPPDYILDEERRIIYIIIASLSKDLRKRHTTYPHAITIRGCIGIPIVALLPYLETRVILSQQSIGCE